jgi:hypothetical protein
MEWGDLKILMKEALVLTKQSQWMVVYVTTYKLIYIIYISKSTDHPSTIAISHYPKLEGGAVYLLLGNAINSRLWWSVTCSFWIYRISHVLWCDMIFVFSIPKPWRGDRKHTTRWIKPWEILFITYYIPIILWTI